MPDLAGLDWATPFGSLLLLAPLLLAALAWRRKRKLAAWAEPHLLPWAVADQAERRRDWRRILDGLAWALLALAAAGPRLPLEEANASDAPASARHVMSLMAVIDVSASMAASDVAPDRLRRARLELTDLLARLHGERAGLILYAGRAGLLLPPTDDTALLARALDQIDADLVAEPGSNVAAALELAAAALAAEKSRSRAVLLLTDAEADSLAGAAGVAARSAAGRLGSAGIPLFVLALASPAGAAIPLKEGGFVEHEGAQVVSRPDANGYGALAQSTGGRYAAVADGAGDWNALYDAGMARLPGASVAPDRVRAWQPLFAWPLALSLALFGLAHLPRHAARGALPPAAAMLLLALGLAPGHEAQANEAQQAAWRAYRAERWGEAAKLYAGIGGYAGQMGAGAAAWKLKDYAAAQRHFNAALLLARDALERSDALYNLGNANYALARWQTAVEAYRAVLQARPGDRRAAANLRHAETQLQQQRKPEPMKTDLRLRPGSLAESDAVNLELLDRESAVQEFERKPAGSLPDRGAAAGASLAAEQAAARSMELEARQLQSGQAKIERLEEHPRTLVQGLLKQDSPTQASSVELSPW